MYIYGLSPVRHQAITWTNADPVHRRIYAALEGEEWITDALLLCFFNSDLSTCCLCRIAYHTRYAPDELIMIGYSVKKMVM